MANYPTSLDSFTNPTGVDSLSSPSHSLQHADANDAIEALEAKVGIGTSTAGSATAGHVLVASTGGTTSWTTVSAGAISTTGGSAGQVLTAGTAGVAEWAYSGLTLIKTQTIGSAVSSVTVSDAFSATYDNYKIIVSQCVGSTVADVFITLGSTNTGYYYSTVYGFANATTASNFNGNNTTSFARTAHLSSTLNSFSFDLISPNLAKNTMIQGHYNQGTSNNGTMGISNGVLNDTTQYTAFTFTAQSGTYTGGTVYVFGYRKS